MHDPSADIQALYSEDLMNLDENIFALDAESRELIFGRTGMGDSSTAPNPQYDGSAMQADPSDPNTLPRQMPTPVSTDIRASEANTFMSPLQVDQPNYERMNGVQFSTHGNEEIFFTPLLSPAVTPMDIIRLHESDAMNAPMDPVYFSPLTSPALERFPQSTAADPRRSQSMVALTSSVPPARRPAEGMNDFQRNVRRAPYSPVARPTLTRKRNSITQLNLNNNSPSEGSSDSVSPEPLPSSSMPPPPPRNSSATKLSDKSVRPSKSQRRKRTGSISAAGDVAPATPSSFLNMHLQHPEQVAPGTRVESTVTFDPNTSTDTSPATIKSASSTPTFGPTSAGAMGSPSFIAIPSSFDPNNTGIAPANVPPNIRKPIRGSRAQGRSSSSSPAFRPIISPNLKPLLPEGKSNEIANQLATKSNYQNILEGNHNHLGLTYPKELSSGIESRRTSHKVAEQARRSRINNAIDQLGTLLPGETEGISKAITVEKAIDYIKNLEEQLAKAKAELAAKKE